MGENELLALAEQVEALQGADRTLDAEIAHLTRWRWDGWEDGDVQIEDRSLEYVIERVQISYNSIWRNVPAYTASLDAAMSLVPEGREWQADTLKHGSEPGKHAWFRLHSLDYAEQFEADAATLALAITAAALRARASLTPTTGEGEEE